MNSSYAWVVLKKPVDKNAGDVIRIM